MQTLTMGAVEEEGTPARKPPSAVLMEPLKSSLPDMLMVFVEMRSGRGNRRLYVVARWMGISVSCPEFLPFSGGAIGGMQLKLVESREMLGM